jgi:hypothetical protein
MTPQVCKKLGVSEQTHYRWRRVYKELRLEQARRLKAHGTGKQSVEEAGGRPGDRHCDFEGSVFGKILSRTDDGVRSSMCAALCACRSAEPVGWWVSLDRLTDTVPPLQAMSHGWWDGSSSWRRSPVGTVIGRSRLSFAMRDGGPITSAWKGCGDAMGFACLRNSRNGVACGLTTARAFGDDPSARITCGRTTSWRSGPTTADR